MQILANLCKFMQIYVNLCKFMEIHVNLYLNFMLLWFNFDSCYFDLILFGKYISELNFL